MLLVLVSLLLCGAVHAGSHLRYIYTAFSEPVDLPSIHQFTAVGLLNGVPIDYYDSDNKFKVPKEKWMEDRMEEDYWKKGTESRKTKEQWFQVNLHILSQRLKKNNTVNHVLQWSHGCELEDKQKVRGYDRYSYDGEDFLSFDSVTKQWVAPMFGALETKRKWDSIQQLNDYTDGYLHKECVDWLQKFIIYRKEALRNAVKPEVYLYAKPEWEHLRLTCFATGFYPKDITMNIKRDGRVLDEDDGLKSTGARPNGDGTHQIKMWLKIPKGDGAKYSCEVFHKESLFSETKEWDPQEDKAETGGGVDVGVVGVGVGVGVVLLVGVGVGLGVAVWLRLGPFRCRGEKNPENGEKQSVSRSAASSMSTEESSLTGSNGSDSGQPNPEKKPLMNGSNGSDSGQPNPEKKSLMNGSNGSDSGNSSGSSDSISTPPKV